MITTILFDLGQVLIRLSDDGPVAAQWLDDDSPFTLQEWFHSPAGLAFERGELSPEAFAEILIRELQLQVTAAQLLAHFSAWPLGWFDGAEELLNKLSARYQLAVLSNTNAVHYPRLVDEFGLLRYFAESDVFASHRIGLAKPDPACFRYVLNRLNCQPSEVLFLDDSPANVASARALGIQARVVTGPQLKPALQALKIL